MQAEANNFVQQQIQNEHKKLQAQYERDVQERLSALQLNNGSA